MAKRPLLISHMLNFICGPGSNFIHNSTFHVGIGSFKWSGGEGTISTGFEVQFCAYVRCRYANCLDEAPFHGLDAIFYVLGWGTSRHLLRVLTEIAPRFQDLAISTFNVEKCDFRSA